MARGSRSMFNRNAETADTSTDETVSDVTEVATDPFATNAETNEPAPEVAETTDAASPVETPADNETAKTDETPAKTNTPRAVDVGEITVQPSSKTSLKVRNSTVDANPVFKAVKVAADARTADLAAGITEEKFYDIVVQKDKVEAVTSTLRRAAQRYKVGMNIDADRVDNGNGTMTVTFGVSERKERPAPKAKATDETPAVSQDEADAHNAGVQL